MAEATDAPIAALDGAVVRYADRAVGPVDITVGRGEIVALVGASGAGKSTALRVLAGLESVASGRVTRDARPGRTGFVFQSPTLMPWADALANVALPLELLGRPRDAARRAAETALVAVGLGSRAGARPRELSGGMAMRVSLARALVTRPDLLLLDEPFAALDTVIRRGLIEDIHRLWVEHRPAVVFVTHDVEEAVYLSHRAVVLDGDGRVAVERASPGSLPRPPGWRATRVHREAVEALTDALAATMRSIPDEAPSPHGVGGSWPP